MSYRKGIFSNGAELRFDDKKCFIVDMEGKELARDYISRSELIVKKYCRESSAIFVPAEKIQRVYPLARFAEYVLLLNSRLEGEKMRNKSFELAMEWCAMNADLYKKRPSR